MPRKAYSFVVLVIVLCIFTDELVSKSAEKLTFINTTVQWCNSSDWWKFCEEIILYSNVLSENDTYLLEGYLYITIANQSVPILYKNSLGSLQIELFEMKNCGLKIIEENAFKNSNITTLSLTHNILDVLRKITFKDAYIVWVLNLNDNLIKTIEDGTFQGLDLDILDLSGNSLEEISHGVFADLNVRYLSIGRNKIKHIKADVFQNIQKLDTLELSYNEIKYLEGPAFHKLQKLRFLYLKKNLLNNVPENVFNSTTFLRLDLRGNNISNISLGAFKNSSVRYLNLADNKLEIIVNGMFTNTSTNFIQYLILSANKIREVEPNALSAVYGSIQLESNYLKSIKNGTFINAVVIVLLNNPKLKTIERGSFNGQINRHNFYTITSTPLLYLDKEQLDEASKIYLNDLVTSGTFILRNSSYVNSITLPFT